MEEAARVEQVRRDVEDGKVPFLLLSLLLIFVAGDGGSGVVRHCRRRFEFLLTTASHSSGVGYGSWPLLNVSGLLLSYVLFDRHSYRWKFKHHLDRLGGFDTLLNDPDTTFGFHVSSTISAQFFPPILCLVNYLEPAPYSDHSTHRLERHIDSDFKFPTLCFLCRMNPSSCPPIIQIMSKTIFNMKFEALGTQI